MVILCQHEYGAIIVRVNQVTNPSREGNFRSDDTSNCGTAMG